MYMKLLNKFPEIILPGIHDETIILTIKKDSHKYGCLFFTNYFLLIASIIHPSDNQSPSPLYNQYF
jgi:hypothetical protein